MAIKVIAGGVGCFGATNAVTSLAAIIVASLALAGSVSLTAVSATALATSILNPICGPPIFIVSILGLCCAGAVVIRGEKAIQCLNK